MVTIANHPVLNVMTVMSLKNGAAPIAIASLATCRRAQVKKPSCLTEPVPCYLTPDSKNTTKNTYTSSRGNEKPLIITNHGLSQLSHRFEAGIKHPHVTSLVPSNSLIHELPHFHEDREIRLPHLDVKKILWANL